MCSGSKLLVITAKNLVIDELSKGDPEEKNRFFGRGNSGCFRVGCGSLDPRLEDLEVHMLGSIIGTQ